jgi:hypothetical protein
MGFKRYLSWNDAIYGSSSYRVNNNYNISSNSTMASSLPIWTVNFISLI